MRIVVVDNSTLQNLWIIGGPSAWDSLLQAADRVVITDQIAEEARRGPHANDFDDWFDRNSAAIDQPVYRSPEAITDINASFPNEIGDLPRTNYTIRNTALPEAGLAPAMAPEFERYDARFDPLTVRGAVEIWISLA